jgi:hypothetical protein
MYEVFIRFSGIHGETEQKDICVLIRQDPEAVIILLSRRVPQTKRHHMIVDS